MVKSVRFFLLLSVFCLFSSFSFGAVVTQTFTVAAEADDGIATAAGLQSISDTHLAIGDNRTYSPLTVTVTLNVLQPEIGVSPGGFIWGHDLPGHDIDEPQVLSIFNSGYDTLNWQISEDCDWLSVDPVSGQCTTGPNEVTLTLNTEGLEIRTYTCDLTITGDNASNSPRTVRVWLNMYRPGERHVPIEYPTIRDAIQAAVDGDHVIIHPGQYAFGFFTYNGKAITVRSIDPTNPEVVASTIVNESVFFNEGEGRDSILDGLTLTRTLTCGGSSPVIKNCVFSPLTPNASPFGLISVYGGNPHIQNCIFVTTQLSPDNGLAIYIEGNRDIPGNTIIENCLISLKYTYSGSYYEKSGIRINDGHADIVNTTIAYCRYALSISHSDVSLKNSIVWGNRASDNVQIAIQNHSSHSNDPDNSHVEITCSNIEGSRENILIFPDDAALMNYNKLGILPDPNLVAPNTLIWGPGNIDADPLFVREANDGGDGWLDNLDTPDIDEGANNNDGDLHLKSQAGRFLWEGFAMADFNMDRQVNLTDFSEMAQNWGLSATSPYALIPYNLNWDGTIDLEDFILFCNDYLQPRVFGAWVADDVTSPCIDTGDPNDIRWQNELWPHGGRTNMGAYGGTAQASMSDNPVGNTADLNHDGRVDLADWSLWSDDFQKQKILLDSDFDRDNHVNPNDLNVFINNWLEGTGP